VTAGTSALLATARAERARHDGELDAGPWLQAIAAWDAGMDPFEAAYARFRFAETELRRSGVKADVTTQLVAAWRATGRLRALDLRRAIEVLARRARVPLTAEATPELPDGQVVPDAGAGTRPTRGTGSPEASPHHTLSAREVEVLRLVAAGRSNGEIGDELFITRKTAGVHVTHILDKLGVSNRVEAAMAAARLGLLDADADEAEPASEPRAG
jgi:DNA-binding CsgD family transcriptional regulator